MCFVCIDAGSSLYDYSMYFAAGAVFLVCCFVVLSRLTSSRWSWWMTLWQDHTVSTVALPDRVVLFCHHFRYHAKLMIMLWVVVFLLSLPVFILRLSDVDHEYSTHWNVYSWVLSFAYMKGESVGVLAVLVWGVGVFVFLCYIIVCHGGGEATVSTSDSTTGRVNDKPSDSPDQEDFLVSVDRAKVALAVVCNVIVTGGVNVLYVLCITELSVTPVVGFTVRLSMSLYRLLSAKIVLPLLSSQVKDPVRNVMFRFRLLLFNNLFIPCVVTALTSPNCFQVCFQLTIRVVYDKVYLYLRMCLFE